MCDYAYGIIAHNNASKTYLRVLVRVLTLLLRVSVESAFHS